jgi:hypothetical protein
MENVSPITSDNCANLKFSNRRNEQPRSGSLTLPVVAGGQNNYGQTNIPKELSGVNVIAERLYHNLALKNGGTEMHRFPEDNLIAAPVCQVGVFALSDTKPQPPLFLNTLYLPIITR